MQLCEPCRQMFDQLVAGWHGRTVTPREVVDTLTRNGYTRLDAARWLLSLLADEFRIRLGFREREDLAGRG